MRLYFDENFAPAIAHGFREFEKGRPSEGVDVFHLTDEFKRGTKDEIWLPQVASRHGCILTQDINIHRSGILWQLCQDNKIGIFFFNQARKHKFDYWGWTRKVFANWSEIKRIAKSEQRPFGYTIGSNNDKLRRL
jgi:hypothetical protein